VPGAYPAPPAGVAVSPRRQALIAIAIAVIAAVLLTLVGTRRREWPRPLSNLEVAEAWLQCSDCRGPFLRRIYETRGRDRDTVTRFLRSALLVGPDSAVMGRVQESLQRTWLHDSLFRVRSRTIGLVVTPGGHPVVIPADTVSPTGSQRASFLSRYTRGFEVRWRGRAAIGLGVIRSDTALAALDSALRIPPQERADTVLQRMVERTKADSGRLALQHYP
jgi:hypothetical protein